MNQRVFYLVSFFIRSCSRVEHWSIPHVPLKRPEGVPWGSHSRSWSRDELEGPRERKTLACLRSTTLGDTLADSHQSRVTHYYLPSLSWMRFRGAGKYCRSNTICIIHMTSYDRPHWGFPLALITPSFFTRADQISPSISTCNFQSFQVAQ